MIANLVILFVPMIVPNRLVSKLKLFQILKMHSNWATIFKIHSTVVSVNWYGIDHTLLHTAIK